MHNESSDVFQELYVLEACSLYRPRTTAGHTRCPPRRVAYALQEPLKGELERLQREQIIVPAGIDETLEWCISFVLVATANGKV